jgi:hypothetical protein
VILGIDNLQMPANCGLAENNLKKALIHAIFC